MLIRHLARNFRNRVLTSKAGIWLPEVGIVVPIHQNVLAILDSEEEGKRLISAGNLVGDAGDIFYAQSAAGEAVTNNFNTGYLSSVTWTTIAKGIDSDDLANITLAAGTGEKTVSATYPKTNDGDADNTGAGNDIVTHLFSYTKGDFNDPSVAAGAISIAANTSWGGAGGNDPVFTGYDFAAVFDKTANDTLKVFVNHTMNGV